MAEKCLVFNCFNETEEGLCKDCSRNLSNKKLLPHLCWNCGSIIDIYDKPERIPDGEVLFSGECRKCGSKEGEKRKLLIKG